MPTAVDQFFIGHDLLHAERFAEAEHTLAAALAAGGEFDHATAHYSLGDARREQPDGIGPGAMARRARASYGRALRLAPRWAAPYVNIGVSFGDDHVGALRAFRRALALTPADGLALSNTLHSATWIADWRGRARQLKALGALLSRELADSGRRAGPPATQPWHVLAYPLPAAVARDVAAAHAAAAAAHSARAAAAAAAAWPRVGAPSARRRLRVAYLSSDLHERHPVGSLVRHVLRLHDRRRLRVACVSSAAVRAADSRDPLGAPPEGCERFVELRSGARDEALGALRGEGILLDLNGNTVGNRPDVLAARPAPVSALAIGYPGGLGGRLVQYALADGVSAPPTSRALYHERLVLHPTFFLAPHPAAGAAAPAEAAADAEAAAAVRAAGARLSTFSQPYKVQPETLASWANALRRAPPASQLVLLRFQPPAVPHLRAELAALGVDGRRLDFLGLRPRDAHLARARALTLSLDTPGYNQGASGLDALQAGLPLLSLPLEQWCGRMGAALLRTSGTPAAVVRSARAAEDVAAALVAAESTSFAVPSRRRRPWRPAPATISVEPARS